MYLRRHIENKVIELSKSFPVVMVCGQRQAGKSTLLYNIKENRNYISLDDIDARSLAKNDPKLFFEKYQYPIVIDEFQRVPEILIEIKRIIDKLDLEGKDTSGLFWLSGSENFKMMKTISESLAGRVAILHLSTLSNREINSLPQVVFNPDLDNLKKTISLSKPMDIHTLFEHIFNGGMPKYIIKNLKREDYFSNYISTYLDRDVHDLEQIGKLNEFHHLMVLLASRISNELNYSNLSKEIGGSCPTVKQWCEILERCGIIYILHPYYKKVNDRLVKTPKVYFLDSGLAAYLAKWPSATILENSAMAGSFFENYVISEIVKSYYNAGKQLNLYYYRDKDQHEIDLVIEDSNKLYPIEIKKNVRPSHGDKSFNELDKFKMDKQIGLIICMSGELKPYNKKTWFVPAWII